MLHLIATFVLSICPGLDVLEGWVDRLPSRATNTNWLIGEDDVSGGALVSLRSIVGLSRAVYEREIVFADLGVRIVETEEVVGQRRTVVYRELRPTGSRTWMVKWRAGDRVSEARTVGYGWDRPVHEGLRSGVPGVDPVLDAGRLELLFRHGTDLSWGSVVTVDPASGAAIRVDLEQSGERCRARRGDGTLLHEVTRSRTVGPQGIASFRLHGAGRVARPIEEPERLSLFEKWRIESRPAHEVMLALIPRRGSIIRR